MSRRPTPWRRGGDKGPWYAQYQGVQHFLAEAHATKQEAYDALTEIMAAVKTERKPKAGGLTFGNCVNLFLLSAAAELHRKEKKPLTIEGYRRFLLPIADSLDRHPIASLKPLHISDWLDKQTWNTTTRNNAITAVKACLNWCDREGHIPFNPVAKMLKPKARVSETDMTPAMAHELIDGARDRFLKDYMVAAFGTGARPSELMALEAKHIDFRVGIAVMDGKTTGSTGRSRVIQVGPVIEILAGLAKKHPEGPLLRNSKGTPWTRHILAHRFKRLRKRLGLPDGITARGFRHGFTTDALEKGIPIATVAELLGHTSTVMVSRHYNKLHKRQSHLADAAATNRPGQGS